MIFSMVPLAGVLDRGQQEKCTILEFSKAASSSAVYDK